MISTLVNLGHEPPISQSHILLMKIEYEHQFFDLDAILEPNPTIEPRLDLNQLLESVLVPVPFTLEPKSIISLNHIPLLDQGVGKYNSEIIYQDWTFHNNNN